LIRFVALQEMVRLGHVFYGFLNWHSFEVNFFGNLLYFSWSYKMSFRLTLGEIGLLM